MNIFMHDDHNHDIFRDSTVVQVSTNRRIVNETVHNMEKDVDQVWFDLEDVNNKVIFLNSPQLMQLFSNDLLALQRRVTKKLGGQERKLGGYQNLKDNEATMLLQVPELHLVKTKS